MSNRLISQIQSNDLRNKAANYQIRRQLIEEFGSDTRDVYILNAPDLTRLWLSSESTRSKDPFTTAETFKVIIGDSPDAVINYTSAILDTVVLAKLGNEMRRSGSILGTYRIIQRNGRSLIVFSGHAGLRRTLTAPVYGISNPKVIKFGVGTAAGNAMLKSGMLLTLIISPVVRTIEWLFIDHKATLELVLARVSADIFKGIIAAGAGYAASLFLTTISGASVIAVAPVAAGIGIALMVGYGLNSIDVRLRITERLAESLVAAKKEWMVTASRTSREFNHYFFTSEGALEFIQQFTGMPRW